MRILIFLVIIFSFTANAADLPQGSRFDNRIQFVNYNPNDVVIIKTLAGIGTRIVFHENEEIIDAGSGFTQGWEIQRNKNILYLKPKSVQVGTGPDAVLYEPESGKWDTNLMIRTSHRLYDFDLKLLAGDGNSERVPIERVSYRVQFKYPHIERQKLIEAVETNIAESKLNKMPIPRNWSYTEHIGDNSENISPTKAYDDGRFTYLTFPNNREFPTVFVLEDDGTESIVVTHVDKDELVIHRVSKQFTLRLGQSVVGVYNENFDPDGLPPEQGTTVDGLERVIINEDK